MACLCGTLSGGVSKGCDGNKGGIRKIYITDFCNVTGFTLASPGGEISGFTMASGALFYEFEFNKNTSTFTEVITGDQANSSQLNTQTITLKLARREKVKRDTLQLLMGFKELAVIVQDGNGLYWYLGEEEGVVMTENNSENGTAGTDFNGYTLTLVGEETTLANEVLPAAVAAVI